MIAWFDCCKQRSLWWSDGASFLFIISVLFLLVPKMINMSEAVLPSASQSLHYLPLAQSLKALVHFMLEESLFAIHYMWHKKPRYFLLLFATCFSVTCIYKSRTPFSLQFTVKILFVSSSPTISTQAIHFTASWEIFHPLAVVAPQQTLDGCVLHYQTVSCIH